MKKSIEEHENENQKEENKNTLPENEIEQLIQDFQRGYDENLASRKLFLISVGGGGNRVMDSILSLIDKPSDALHWFIKFAIGNRFLFINTGPELINYKNRYGEEHILDIGFGKGTGTPGYAYSLYKDEDKKTDEIILKKIHSMLLLPNSRARDADSSRIIPLLTFIIINSCGGGTGSGITPLLIQDLLKKYMLAEKEKSFFIFNFIILPESDKDIGKYTVPYTLAKWKEIYEIQVENPQKQEISGLRTFPILLSNAHFWKSIESKRKDSIEKMDRNDSFTVMDLNPLILKVITPLFITIISASIFNLEDKLRESFCKITNIPKEEFEKTRHLSTIKEIDEAFFTRNLPDPFIVPLLIEGAPAIKGDADYAETYKQIFSTIKKSGLQIIENEFYGTSADIGKDFRGLRAAIGLFGNSSFANEDNLRAINKILTEKEKIYVTDPVYLSTNVLSPNYPDSILIIFSQAYSPEFLNWMDKLQTEVKLFKKAGNDIYRESKFTFDELKKFSEVMKEWKNLLHKKRETNLKRIQPMKTPKKSKTSKHSTITTSADITSQKPKVCKICSQENPPDASTCSTCGVNI